MGRLLKKLLVRRPLNKRASRSRSVHSPLLISFDGRVVRLRMPES
jgi:hypothetical protein